MAESILKLVGEYDSVVSMFEDVKIKIDGTESNIDELNKSTKSAFEQMAKEAKKFTSQVGQNKEFKDSKEAINAQIQLIQKLTAEKKKTNDPAQIAAYNKQIQIAQIAIKQIAREEQKRGESQKQNGGLINQLVIKEKLLTEARNRSINPELINKYNKLIDETKRRLKELQTTQEVVRKESNKTFFQKLKEAIFGIKSANKEAKSLGSTLKEGILSVFGGNLLFSGFQKIKQGFDNLKNVQVSFQKQVQNLSAITGASGKDLEFYGEQAIEMGRDIEGGAVAAVEAYKLIGSAKPDLLKNKEALVDVTDAAITLSQASGLTLPSAAENLGNALNSYEEDASQAVRITNVLAASAQLGAKEIPFITEALSKFGGVAKAANISIEESAAAVEILGAKIPEASTVGTNLRSIFVILQTEAAKQGRQFKSLGEELDLLGGKVKDITFLEKVFGRENILAAQTLISQREELKKLKDGVTGTNSAFEQAAINTNTLAQSILRADNAYEGFLLSLKESNGIINSLTKAYATFFEGLSGQLEKDQNIERFSKLTGVSKELSKELINLGLTTLNTAQAQEELNYRTISGKKSNDTLIDETIKKAASIAIYGKALDLTIEKIKASNDQDLSSRKIKAVITTQLSELKAAYEKGAITIEDYTIKLKLLSLASEEVKKSFKKNTDDLIEQAGIIETLQKDIESLTQQRIKATTEDAIDALTLQIEDKQKKLDNLLKKARGIIGRLQKEIADLTEKQSRSESVTEIKSLSVQIEAKQKKLDELLGKTKKVSDEFEQAIIDLQKRVEQARIELSSGETRIELENKVQKQELEVLKKHLIELGIEKDKNFKMSLEQEEQFAYLSRAIDEKSAKDKIKLEVDKQNQLIEIRKKANSQTEEQLNINEQSAINTIESVKKPDFLKDFQEVDFENEKQKQILAVQEEYARKRLELKKKSLADERNAEIKELDLQLKLIGNGDDKETVEARKHISEKLEILEKDYDLQNQEIEAQTDKTINEINAKRSDLNKQKPFSLKALFGLSDAEAQNLQTALTEASNALTTIIQSEIEDQNSNIELSRNKISGYESEIDALRSKLESEQQLKQEGLASNTTRIQEEIAQKEYQLAQEKESERKALEEKKKLQKEQAVIDSIVQAANLVTASSNILATTAKDPISLAIAFTAIGAMISGFIATRTQAAQAANNINLAEGAIGIKGPGTETSDSIPANLSVGESVISAKKTKKHKNLLLGIHNEDDALIKVGIAELIKGTGITLSETLGRDFPEVIALKKESARQAEINNVLNVDNSRLEKQMSEMKDVLVMILKENKEKYFTDSNGNLNIKKGGHRVIIKSGK